MKTKTKLEDLGYNANLEQYRKEQHLDGFEVGRVAVEHRERYIVLTEKGEYEAEITGNMRFTARSREDFPAVGDWVALNTYDDGPAIIHHILPRYSIIRRQAVGQYGEAQVIAANIDIALILQALDRDFNMNRLERYLTICHGSKVTPVIVLTKIDLADEQRLSELKGQISRRMKDIPVIAISNLTGKGYELVKDRIEKGMTYCLLGSSGVGKSTLLNNLAGSTIMKADAISEATKKGRHVTSHRELILLESGGIIIDNPGMREVGIVDTDGGLETAFERIIHLSGECRFKNCTHTGEAGCAVLAAVKKGEIEGSAFENYMKMEREKAYFESTVAERRKKEKIFGKMLKDYQKKDIKKRNH